LLKAELWSQERQSLLGNVSANTRLSSRHVLAATDKQATTEELLEAVFTVQSMPRLYNEDQLPLRVESNRESLQAVGRQLQMGEVRSW
jgi:hypothetical protein